MNTETDSKSVRKRKHPDRFGDAAISIDSGSEHDFSDNSMDDRNYLPVKSSEEESPKIVATVKRPRLEKNTANSTQMKEHFDDIFDEIDNKIENRESSSPYEKNSAVESGGTIECTASANLKSNTDSIALKEMLIRLNEKFDEIMARMIVLERVCVQSSQNRCSRDLKMRIESEYNKHRAFIESIGFPFTQLQDLQEFENDLNDFKYFTSMVCNTALH